MVSLAHSAEVHGCSEAEIEERAKAAFLLSAEAMLDHDNEAYLQGCWDMAGLFNMSYGEGICFMDQHFRSQAGIRMLAVVHLGRAISEVLQKALQSSEEKADTDKR